MTLLQSPNRRNSTPTTGSDIQNDRAPKVVRIGETLPKISKSTNLGRNRTDRATPKSTIYRQLNHLRRIASYEQNLDRLTRVLVQTAGAA